MLAVALSVGAPTSAFGQDEVTPPAAAPAAPDVPGLLGCSSTPYFGLQQNMPYMGEQVPWRAAGLRVNSQISIVATDLLNPQNTFRTSAVGNGWCQAMGAIVLPRPVQYQVTLIGVSALTGETVELTAWPFAMMPPPTTPVAAPIPMPSAPSALRATQLNGTTVRLDWTDNSANASSLVVTSRTGEYPVQAGSSTMNVGGLSPNQAYCFTIFAVNTAGRTAGGGDCLTIRSMDPAIASGPR
jgi:hypothetical protein